MKLNLIKLLFFLIITNVYSQVWQQVSTPYEYISVYNITSINDEVFVSKFDRDLGTNGNYANYIFKENKWVRAERDTIYELFGKPSVIVQNKNNIIVSCRNGIFLSVDSAKSWTKLEGQNFTGDCDISPNGIFGIKESSESHLFKYDETKKVWEQLQDNKYDTLEYFFVKQVESNKTHVFALQQKVANPFKYKDTVSGGLFVSTDKGESWEKTLNDSMLLSVFVNEDYVLVSTIDGRLWKSINNGKTWTENNIGTTINNFTFDAKRIIATSNPAGIIESINNGESWQVLNEGLYNSEIYKKEDKYFLKHYNLVYESDSLFTEVKPTNLINNSSQVNYIYKHNDTLLCVGNFSRGVQYSTDTAKSWHTYYPFLEDELVSINKIFTKENQFYLTASYRLFSSIDYGKTFDENMTPGFSNLLILDDKILFYNTNGRYISKDFGKTYSSLDTTVIKNNYRIGKIVQAENGNLFAFSTFNGVFKSSDNANTWTKLIDSLPIDTTFASIEKFYEFGGNYYIINSTPLRLLKSTDKGDSWSKVEIELFNQVQYSFPEMIDENNIILSSYGDGLNGLWITNDQGKTWRRIDEDLPPLSKDKYTPYGVRGIFGNIMFVGSSPSSFGGSLYLTTLDKLGVKTSVETQRNYLYTLPPYPLPSQNEVKVQFYWDINLPMTADDISVYDITGRKLITKDKIRLEKQAEHYGNLIWDCSSEEPGIYLINIKHGTEERSIKVVVE